MLALNGKHAPIRAVIRRLVFIREAFQFAHKLYWYGRVAASLPTLKA